MITKIPGGARDFLQDFSIIKSYVFFMHSY